MPHLKLHRRRRNASAIPLRADVTTIGRTGIGDRDEPDIRLPDSRGTVSRYHAAVVRAASGRFFVRDLGSANGTRLNGSLIYRSFLSDGDTITIDRFDMVYHHEDLALPSRPTVVLVDEKRSSPSPVGGTTQSEVSRSTRSIALPPDRERQVGDMLQRCAVLAGQAALFDDLVMLATYAARAERGAVISVGEEDDVTAIASYNVDTESNREFRLDRNLLFAALYQGTVQESHSSHDGVRLYVPLYFDLSVRSILYLEAPPGTGLSSLDVQVIRAFVNGLANIWTLPVPDRSGVDGSRADPSDYAWRAHMVGNSRPMLGLRRAIRIWAARTEDLLLLGETGTGKSMAARAIHDQSRRRGGPFCVVEIPAKSEHVIESELFGHVKGSFTGTAGDRTGAFEAANGGTLVLEEIGDISPKIQAKLRRAIEDKEIYPVGSQRAVRVDVRLISATNRDLLADVATGKFRQDLYQRLGHSIRMPSLREHREDIPLLLHYLLDKEPGTVQGIAHGVLQDLIYYDWPGNVRELQRVVTEMAVRARGEVLFSWDLPSDLTRDAECDDPSTDPVGVSALARVEEQAILRALNENNWNKTRAAKALQISRQALHSKIKRFGI